MPDSGWVERSEIVRDVSPASRARATSDGLFVELLELGRVPGAEVVDEGDLIWVTGRLGSVHIVRTRIAPGAEDPRIEGVLAGFEARGLPVSWWIEPEARPADLGARLAGRGLERSDRDAGMALDLGALVVPPDVPGMRIAEVGIEVPVEPFLALGRTIFAWTDEVLEGRRQRIAHDDRPDRPRRHYVGLIGDRAVAMATVYTRHGLAVVGGVGTDPAFRRRGIASRLTAEALVVARQRGYAIATLQASELGAPVYERLGFIRVGWYERWTTAGAAPMVAPEPQ